MEQDASITPSQLSRARVIVIVASAFVIAGCGLVYELMAGTLAAYLLGDATQQYSITIGIFLAAMGLGSYLSRFITKKLLWWFVATEFAIGVVGGIMPLALFFIYGTPIDFWLAVIVFSVIIGALVGLEIPLIVRTLRARYALASTVGGVLAVDYFGALAAGLLFPLLIVPHLGLVRAGFVFGAINVFVGLIAAWVFGKRVRSLLPVGVVLLVALLIGVATAGTTSSWAEDTLYDDSIIYAKNTKKQRVVMTRWRNDLRLYINGNLQFSAVDERRYHEALVHPLLASHKRPASVLVLGGGDGLVARELLKYDSVKQITIVDFDPEMLRIAREVPALRDLNNDAYRDPRVRLVTDDAMKFAEQSTAFFDIIIADLPDPNQASLAKLYSTAFYRLLLRRLRVGGMFVTQATSTFFSPAAFASIRSTLLAAAPESHAIHGYRVEVPSFGEWGFILVAPREWSPEAIDITVAVEVVDTPFARSLFVLPKSVRNAQGPVNTLDKPVLHHLYQKNYRSFYH